MTAVYAHHQVKPGDALLCTVTDWARGHYTLEYIPTSKRRAKRAVQKWITDLETAIYDSGSLLTVHDEIYDQLALALFAGPPSLRQAPPTHFGGFISQSPNFTIHETPFGTLLRAPDDDLDDILEQTFDTMEEPHASGRYDSLEAILNEVGLTATVDEIEAYMHDELSRGGNEMGEVMKRLLAGRYGIEFYDDRQAVAFDDYLAAMWARVQSEFDPKHDQLIAPLRARILAILDSHVAWLRDCDRIELPPTDLPHELSVELATISGILSQVLELLNRDKNASAKDIRDLGENIEIMEAHSNQVLTQLRAVSHPSTPPKLTLWRPDTAPATPQVYQLRVDLKHIRPPIWRRLLVPSTATLAELHTIIQTAMGWYNCHLHEFKIGRISYGPADDDSLFAFGGPDADTTVPLHAVLHGEGSKFSYSYDFGDDWQHTIKVEKVLPLDEKTTYPRCIKGKRACPPEDCGGPWGYENLLEALSDPTNPNHKELAEWAGPLNPEHLDLIAINSRLTHP